MKEFKDLRRAVAAYMTRDPSAFVREGFDCLTQAINDAHQWAQRSHIFERAYTEITFPSVSISDGAALSTAVVRGTSTAVLIRALKMAWLPTTEGGLFPLNIISRQLWVERVKRRYDTVVNNNVSDNPPTVNTTFPLEVVFTGQKIHFTSMNATVLTGQGTTELHFDAIEWLPDYTEDDDNDFFLDFCFDFMTFRSVYQLNHYLKEDQRVPVSKSILDDAWDSVIKWDTSFIINSTSDTRLD